MKWSLTVCSAVLFTGPIVWAGTNPAAQQILKTAERQAALFRESRGPFVMDADLTAQFDSMVSGHVQIRWLAEDRWWQKLTLGPYQETIVHDGERVYTLRNVAFTPIRVRELQTLLRFAKDPSQLTAEGMKERHGRDGAQVCIRFSRPDPSRLKGEVCVDPASHDIVGEEYDSFGGTLRTMFRNYAEFNGLRFPRKLELYVDKNITISATVVALETWEFDLGLLTPPQGAIERRDCAGKIHPVPIKTPQPDVLSSPARTANAMLAITVQKDGSVSDIVAVGGSTHSLDRVTIDALKAWKFKPAMCGDEPVVDDITISMQYGNH